MFNPELLTWIAAVFELTGIYLLGKHKRLGFILNIISGIIWISYSLISGSAYGLVMICSVAFILNIKGFINWGNKNEAKKIT